MTTNPSLGTGASTSRRRFVLAGRIAAGLAISGATLAVFGGSAFASDGDPIVPMPDPAFEPVFEFEPIQPIDPPFSTIPLDIPELPELPEDTVPEDDGPILTIPDDIFIPEIPLDIPEIPVCVEWNPADLSVSSVDNGDLTATVTLAYAVDPKPFCDELFVIHSVQEDAAMMPIVLLAEEHVTILDLAADADFTIDVIVPLDPCYTRVFTHGPEALLLQDDHYGEGCPEETTTTTEPVTETTEPPVETTDPTLPPTVPPTVPQTVPQTSVPGGTLPQTGSSSSVIALLGAALVLTGGCLAIGVRKSQTAA